MMDNNLQKVLGKELSAELNLGVRLGLRKKCGMGLFLVAFSLFFSIVSSAADHIDKNDGVSAGLLSSNVDITDVFAWTPAAGRLAVVMDLYYAAHPGAQFSNAANYTFRIRRAQAIRKAGSNLTLPQLLPVEEFEINCNFNQSKQVTCSTSGGHNLITAINQNGPSYIPTGTHIGANQINGEFKLFAGLRADPFYLDAVSFISSIQLGTLLMPALFPINTLAHLSVLSIILEFNTSILPGDPKSLITVSVETGIPGGKTIDGMGRPELTNMLVRTDSYKQIHNESKSSQILKEADINADILAKITQGIIFWDQISLPFSIFSSEASWAAKDLADLSQILVRDYLVVDPQKVCGQISPAIPS